MTDKIRTLGPGSLMIGETGTGKDFSVDAIKVTLTPETSTEDPVTYLDGHEEVAPAKTTWKLEGTVHEDYTTEGVQAWCLNNAGKTMTFAFVPAKAGKIKATGNATITPIAFGGDVKSTNGIDFSFQATNVKIEANTPN